MEKITPTSIRLPPEALAALRKAAEEDGRSLHSLLLRIVTEWLRGKGYAV